MPYWDERFAAIAADYPDVETDQFHIDILSAHFVQHPDWFDVVVGSNLFGDILSDLGAAVVGGMGLAPAANINPERTHPSMFEPVHGSAPDIAGRGIANPIAQVWTGAMMLDHLGHAEAARSIEAAIARVLADGRVMTPDLGGDASTEAMGRALVDALGAGPARAREFSAAAGRHRPPADVQPAAHGGCADRRLRGDLRRHAAGPRRERGLDPDPSGLFAPSITAPAGSVGNLSSDRSATSFLHGGAFHLIINMVMLAAFGAGAERVLGPRRTLGLFLVCGVVGAFAHLAIYPSLAAPVVGASGAISGLFGAVLRLMASRPRSRGGIRLLPVALIWIGFAVLVGFAGAPGAKGVQIAWAAHVGGFMAGLALLPLFAARQSGPRVRP